MKKIIGLLILTFLIVQFGLAKEISERRSFSKPNIIGQLTRMDINRIDLPLENDGAYGDEGHTYFPNGSSNSFLYEGGFGMSAYDDAGELKVSWVMKASRIADYQPGPWGTDPDDPAAKFYIVTKDDKPGSDAYIDWATAVSLGASYVDVNGDGAYDPNVDKPDLIGDKTIWSVINDGVKTSDRELVDAKPLGIEIYHSVFAFSRSDDLGNVIFMRYRVKNVSGKTLNDAIFSVINDPDLGDYQDDLIGCDTTLSLGFVYNPGADAVYGANPPAYGVDFFQGPVVVSPGDTAYRFLGPDLGVDTLIGYKNLPMTSFMYYIQGNDLLGDPDLPIEARRYMEGLDRYGDPIDPTEWELGRGGSSSDNPKYIFSGDPVTDQGWLDNSPSDKRFMLSSGPFPLPDGEYQDIVIALVVGQGDDHLESVTKLKEIDQKAQAVFNTNFNLAGPPPVPPFDVADVNGKLRVSVDLSDVINYRAKDLLGSEVVFGGFAIYQYRSPSTTPDINGIPNEKLVAAYDLYGKNIYLQEGSASTLVWKAAENHLSQTDKGIMIELEGDAFNSNLPFIPGKTYHFALVPFGIDISKVVELNSKDWAVPPGGFLFPAKSGGQFSITFGSDELKNFTQASSNDNSGIVELVEGSTDASLDVVVTDPTKITGHDYKIEIFYDSDTKNYNWRIIDLNLNQIKLDSIKSFAVPEDEENYKFPVVDGLMFRFFNPEPLVENVTLSEGTEDDIYFDWGRLSSIYGYTSYYSWANGYTDFRPSRLVFDTQKNYVAHLVSFGALGYQYDGDTTKTYVAAYDISDPDNPRQVNVLIRNVGATEDLDMDGTFERSFITSSNYSTDTSFYPLDPGFPVVGDAIITFWPVLKDTTYSIMQAKLAFDFTFVDFVTDEDAFVVHSGLINKSVPDSQKNALMDKINVVPNPYWAYSSYETSYDTQILKFTHIPGHATIRIFNLAGQLVKVLEGEGPLMTWNLKNEAGLRVASGMYIAHIEVEGMGSKVLKFAIVQREERIDRY